MSQLVLLNAFSLRYLVHDRRTWLTLVGVALGIAVFMAIRMANESVLGAYRQSVEALAGRTDLEILGLSGPLDEGLLLKLREEPAILEMAPLVQSALPLASPSSAAGEVLLVMGVDFLQEAPFRNYRAPGLSNEALIQTLLNPSAALLTKSFAARHKLEVGDSFSVRKAGTRLEFKIAGLLSSKGLPGGRDGNMAFIDIAAAQWRLGKLGKLDRIDLITDESVPLDALISSLSERLGKLALIRRPHQRGKQVEKMIFSFQMNLTALSAISLFVGLFLIYNTLLVSVVHRRTEIGLLRALGVDRHQIFRLFAIEGIVMGASGGFMGTLCGAALARWVVQIMSRTVSALYVAVPRSPFSLPAGTFLEGIAIGVLVAGFSSVYPAWLAARMKPREAMDGIYSDQQEADPKRLLLLGLTCGAAAFLLSQIPAAGKFSWSGYLSAAMILAAFALMVPAAIRGFAYAIHFLTPHFPPSWRLAEGHLNRSIRLNGPTISAFMGALAMMISVVIMIESFRQTVVTWIDQTIRSDIIGFPADYMAGESDETLPVSLISKLAALPDIQAVDGYRKRKIFFRGETVQLVGRDLAVHLEHSRYLFRTGDSKTILREALASNKVLLSEVFAARFGLQEGERIEIPTPSGPVAFIIGGIFYEYSTDGGKMLIDRTHFKRLWQDEAVDVVAIYLKEGTAAGNMRDRLVQQWGTAQGLAFTTQVDFKAEIMTIFDQTFMITYALEWIAVVVALLGITNTLFVSILERRREIAVLRAIGASRAQVIQLVLVEALYMGVVGYLLGLICAFFLSLLLIFVINKASFGWTLLFHFPPEIIFHAFLLASATALLAGYLPAKKAAEMDLKAALAYE